MAYRRQYRRHNHPVFRTLAYERAVCHANSTSHVILGRQHINNQSEDVEFGLKHSCTTQLKAQGPSRTCNDSKEEEKTMRRVCALQFRLKEGGTVVPRSRENSTPLGPSQGPRHSPTVGSQGALVSYERGTPVRLNDDRIKRHT